MQTKLFLKTSILAFIIIGLIHTTYSQKAPIKYGTVSKADLEMNVYPLDTGAVAVILCDYGYFSTSTYDFTRLLRIKILKKDGTSWGDRIFPTSEKTDIRGITYNLENGEIVETKLQKESIYVERITEDSYRTRVAMPNVREGSIIDLEFKSPWLPSEWRFQDVIPVRYSELVINYSPYINFRKNFFGFVQLNENSDTRWVAKDVPAFKEEPYMSSETNYISKFEIEVLSIAIPPTSSTQGFYREYCTTWEAVNERLLKSTYFGQPLKGGGYLNEAAEEIKAKYTNPLDQVKAAQEFIRNTVKWNDIEALYISGESLGGAYNDKIGNSADVNLMLILLLSKMNLNVWPVALSTRDNGFLSPVFPSLDKLNYVVARVTINDNQYLVDATEDFDPVGLLPERCLNLKGRLINGSSGDWIDLTPVKKNKKVIQYNVSLGNDMSLIGEVSKMNYDYAALNYRNYYSSFNSSDEYLTDVESDHPGMTITDFVLTDLDSIYKPVQESYKVKFRNQVTTSGDLVYINPMLTEKMEDNPFKAENRQFPVDFIYPMEITYLSKITIPENAQVVELPKGVIFKLPDNSASMVYQISQIGNSLNLTYKFSITKTIYNTDEYADMRAFFSEMVKKQTEPVILKFQ